MDKDKDISQREREKGTKYLSYSTVCFAIAIPYVQDGIASLRLCEQNNVMRCRSQTASRVVGIRVAPSGRKSQSRYNA